jgi:2-methylisocitrate lyase-like PEP mutase family enzyme
LRSLHVRGDPLLLPNAWDAASAKAVVDAGFPAVATTSGGVAVSLGYEDHEAAPAEEMFAAAARIASAVEVPVTVDAEAGYGLAAADMVDRLFAAGAAGCNIEDTDHATGRLLQRDRQAERLASIRQAASDDEYGLVINARIDVFLAERARPQRELLDEAVVRARAYRAAGVDCVYPIFLHDEETIVAFLKEMDGPVNILAVPQSPPIARLAELGVARISWGSGIHRRTMDQLAELLAGIAAAGRSRRRPP